MRHQRRLFHSSLSGCHLTARRFTPDEVTREAGGFYSLMRSYSCMPAIRPRSVFRICFSACGLCKVLPDFLEPSWHDYSWGQDFRVSLGQSLISSTHAVNTVAQMLKIFVFWQMIYCIPKRIDSILFILRQITANVPSKIHKYMKRSRCMFIRGIDGKLSLYFTAYICLYLTCFMMRSPGVSFSICDMVI